MQKMFGILPMLGGGGVMAFMISSGGGGMRLVMSGVMAVSMVGMYLSQMGGGGKGGERKHQINGSRRDYLRYLGQLRRRVRTAANRQREALEWRYPDPDSLWILPLSRRLWERRSTDNDFGHVRVARGSQRFVLRLIAPETKPVEDLEPVAAGALRRFIQTYRTIPDIPVAVNLRAFAQVRLEGDPESVRALSRAMLAHLAALHAPHELVIATCLAPDRRAEWDWIKWLPHALHPDQHRRGGPDQAGQLLAVRARTLAGRPGGQPVLLRTGRQAAHRPAPHRDRHRRRPREPRLETPEQPAAGRDRHRPDRQRRTPRRRGRHAASRHSGRGVPHLGGPRRRGEGESARPARRAHGLRRPSRSPASSRRCGRPWSAPRAWSRRRKRSRSSPSTSSS